MIKKRIVYIIKKNHTGKADSFFFAYDYETRVYLHFHKDKEALVEFLNEQPMEILNEP